MAIANTPRKVNSEYLDQRLSEMSIAPALNSHIVRRESTKGMWTEENVKFFESDEEGDIIINYFNLSGLRYSWKKEGAKWPINFQRTRLHTPKGDQKYHQEKGSGQFPFFPPRVLKKYQVCSANVLPDGGCPDPIETLIIVEGEFKAFKGDMVGLDIVGVPSIHGFYNGDVRGKLHEDIQELIITCCVQKVVYLVDADLLTLKWEENKDLAKRAETFFSAIKLFRESLQLLLDDDSTQLEQIVFTHLKTKFVDDGCKGLDDLLTKYSNVIEDIKNDLLSFQFAKRYFDGFLINDLNKDVTGRMFKYLGLFNEQEFYGTYKDFIGAREFKFKKRRYVYDQESKEVKYVRHEDADKFMRIGPDWVKIVSKQNKFGERENEILPWKITEIQRDYKPYADFVDQIPRFDDFCNEPDWGQAYLRSVNGCYNLCEPLKWKPKRGAITHTETFLRHVFQGNGKLVLNEDGIFEREEGIIGDPFTVALDYLTIMLRSPKQMLPVPILVSPENGTGKSTFLKWLQMIFGTNMCILGNAQFQMKFNGHYATKFIIGIDEGFLEIDKKAEKERLKQLVTADDIYLEFKGMNVRKVAFYGKLIICSNDADRVMKIDEGESRWFVIRVPVITKENKDPDLETKMKSEVEAWLDFLWNREIIHPRSDRLWFSPEHFLTDQFRRIVDATKNRVDRVFESWIEEQFLLYKLPALRYTSKYLAEVFNDSRNNKYRIDELDLKTYLKSKGLKPEGIQWVKTPIGFQTIIDPGADQKLEIEFFGKAGRPYVFQAKEWLSPEAFDEAFPVSSNAAVEVNSDELPF